jgi:hypothetical protein
LAVVLLSQRQWAKAEATARECLARYEKIDPTNSSTFNCRSSLGLILTSEQKYSEAEPLLLAAYDGLSRAAQTHPNDLNPRVREALERLVQLYEAIPRPDEARRWKGKLVKSDGVAAASEQQLLTTESQASALPKGN